MPKAPADNVSGGFFVTGYYPCLVKTVSSRMMASSFTKTQFYSR